VVISFRVLHPLFIHPNARERAIKSKEVKVKERRRCGTTKDNRGKKARSLGSEIEIESVSTPDRASQ
jgi:hypothetical protein